LNESSQNKREKRGQGRRRRRSFGWRWGWIQHNPFAFAQEFETGLEIDESLMSFLSHRFLIGSINEPCRERAIISLLNDVITKPPLFGCSGKQRRLEHIGSELFIDVRRISLRETGSGNAENEDEAKQWTCDHIGFSSDKGTHPGYRQHRPIFSGSILSKSKFSVKYWRGFGLLRQRIKD